MLKKSNIAAKKSKFDQREKLQNDIFFNIYFMRISHLRFKLMVFFTLRKYNKLD